MGKMNRITSLGWIFAAALLAAGCVKETRPLPVLQATQATAEIPQDQLLDVGVHILDPGVPKEVEDDPEMMDKRRIYPEIRAAEARYIAMQLRDTLEDTGHWGTARVVPSTVSSFDLTVDGEILESNGAYLKLKVTARDATGHTWFADREYEGRADTRVYSNTLIQGYTNMALCIAQEGTESMSKGGISRRTFLKASAAAGGGLLLSFSLPALMRNAEAAETATANTFAPNAFIRIDRQGRVTLVVHQVEMGQGTYTSLPMLLAEELEVDLAQVHLEHAPPDDKLYANPLVGFQATGGSTSVRGAWEPLRRAGAAARSMLVSAACATWKVDADSCRAEKGEVIHVPTGRKLNYGALVDKAATLPVPDQVALKDPKDFKLIGTPAKRLDSQDKVNGKAQFSIDVKVPGMKIATVAACPVFGGKLASVDDSQGEGDQGRAPGGAPRRRRGGGRRSHVGGQAGPGRARHPLG